MLQLQQRISQRTPHQRTPSPDRLRRSLLIQTRIHLDQIHRHQIARLVHTLADEVALAQGQTAAHGGAGAGRPLGVQAVDVEGEMDGSVVAYVGEGHFDNAADAVSR